MPVLGGELVHVNRRSALQRRIARRRAEDGFTVLELVVTTLIMSVVVSVAATVLVSLTVAASRNGATVKNEQDASSILTEMARDIRSATAVSFPTSSPASEVQLSDEVVSGSSTTTSTVQWSVNGSILQRSVLINGAFVAGPYSVKLANNTATNPVFSYYTYKTPNVALSYPTDSLTDFQLCTTTIGVDLVVARTVNSSQSTYEATQQVALTNELDVLTTPGNGYCK